MFNLFSSYQSGGSNVIKNYEDIDKFRQSCGASSVMLARVAMWNCSIFRREGLIHVYDVIKRFLTIVSYSKAFVMLLFCFK